MVILLNLAPAVPRKRKMLSAELGIPTGEQKAFTSNARGLPKLNSYLFEHLLHARHGANGVTGVVQDG